MDRIVAKITQLYGLREDDGSVAGISSDSSLVEVEDGNVGRQLDLLLESLQLGIYDRQELSPAKLLSLVRCQVSASFEYPSAEGVATLPDQDDLFFRVFAIFVSSLDLWMLSEDERPRPSLLSAGNDLLNSFNTLLLHDIDTASPQLRLLAFAWSIFSLSFIDVSADVVMTVKCRDGISVPLMQGSLRLLLDLSIRTIRSKERGPGVSTISLVYSTMLQEFLGALISSVCFDETLSDLVDMTEVVGLIELSYRSDPNLCSTFWGRFQNPSSRAAYPPLRLFFALMENGSHQPRLFLRFLSSVICSEESVLESLKILLTPIAAMTWTPVACLLLCAFKDEEHSFDKPREWLRLAEWMQRRSLGEFDCSLQRARVKFADTVGEGKRVTASIPEPGCVGVVIAVDDARGQLLVRWDDESSWWSILLETLAASRDVEHKDCSISDLNAAMAVLNGLCNFDKKVSMRILSDSWDNLSLLRILRDMNASALLSRVLSAGISYTSILEHPKHAYDTLMKIGVPDQAAYSLTVRIHSGRENFTSDLTSLLASLLAFFVSALMQSSGIAEELAEGICCVLKLLSRTLNCSPRWRASVLRSLGPEYPVVYTSLGSIESLYVISTQRDNASSSVSVLLESANFLLSLLSSSSDAENHSLYDQAISFFGNFLMHSDDLMHSCLSAKLATTARCFEAFKFALEAYLRCSRFDGFVKFFLSQSSLLGYVVTYCGFSVHLCFVGKEMDIAVGNTKESMGAVLSFSDTLAVQRFRNDAILPIDFSCLEHAYSAAELIAVMNVVTSGIRVLSLLCHIGTQVEFKGFELSKCILCTATRLNFSHQRVYSNLDAIFGELTNSNHSEDTLILILFSLIDLMYYLYRTGHQLLEQVGIRNTMAIARALDSLLFSSSSSNELKVVVLNFLTACAVYHPSFIGCMLSFALKDGELLQMPDTDSSGNTSLIVTHLKSIFLMSKELYGSYPSLLSVATKLLCNMISRADHRYIATAVEFLLNDSDCVQQLFIPITSLAPEILNDGCSLFCRKMSVVSVLFDLLALEAAGFLNSFRLERRCREEFKSLINCDLDSNIQCLLSTQIDLPNGADAFSMAEKLGILNLLTQYSLSERISHSNDSRGIALFDIEHLERNAPHDMDPEAFIEFCSLIRRLNEELLVFSSKERVFRCVCRYLIARYPCKDAHGYSDTSKNKEDESPEIREDGQSLVLKDSDHEGKMMKSVTLTVLDQLRRKLHSSTLIAIDMQVTFVEILFASLNYLVRERDAISVTLAEEVLTVSQQLFLSHISSSSESICYPDSDSKLKLYPLCKERLFFLLLSVILSTMRCLAHQDAVDSEALSAIRVELFQIVFYIFYSGWEGILSTADKATYSIVSSAQLALKVLSVLIPNATALKVTGYLWHSALCKINVEMVLISAVQELCNRFSENFILADFSAWPEPRLLKENGSIRVIPPKKKVARTSSLLFPLLSCFEVAQNLIVQGVVPHPIRFAVAVIDVINCSATLISFQEALAKQPPLKAAVYMGYNGASGDISAAAILWLRCLEFVTALAACNREINSNNAITFVPSLSSFLKKYTTLILVPWSDGRGPFSPMSLKLARYTAALVAEILRFPLYLSMLPAASLQILTSVAGKTIITFAGIVGDGTESTYLNHQRLLALYSVDVANKIQEE